MLFDNILGGTGGGVAIFIPPIDPCMGIPDQNT